MVEISPDGYIISANSAFCIMIGYTRAELSEMTVADVLFPEDRARVLAQFGEVASGRAARVRGGPAVPTKGRFGGSAAQGRVAARKTRRGSRRGCPPCVIDLTERKRPLEDQLQRARKGGGGGRLPPAASLTTSTTWLGIISGCAVAGNTPRRAPGPGSDPRTLCWR